MRGNTRYAVFLAVLVLFLSSMCAHSRRSLQRQALEDNANGRTLEVNGRLHESVSVGSIGYLLFAAAEPLVKPDGSSSNLLLPFLRPIILQLSDTRCNPTLATDLKQLAQRMSGTSALQACEYDLYKSLHATFTWVRENVPLKLQEVDGQPDAAFVLPDLPKPELAAAVQRALMDETKLGGIALIVGSRCGLSSADFAALVPDISSALAGLHGELDLLRSIARGLARSNTRSPEQAHPIKDSDDELVQATDKGSRASDGSSSDGRALERTLRAQERVVHVDAIQYTGGSSGTVGVRKDVIVDIDGDSHVSETLSSWSESSRIRSADQRTSGASSAAVAAVERYPNFVYDMPPQSGYVYADASSMPPILIPMIFHIFSYRINARQVGPKYLERAPAYVDRLVRTANLMTKPTNVQFFVKEVRTNYTKFPYLISKNYTAWVQSPNVLLKCGMKDTADCMGPFNGYTATSMVEDFGRSINVFISSVTSGAMNLLGFAASISLSDIIPSKGYIWLSWSNVLVDDDRSSGAMSAGPGNNNRRSFELGANVMAHEAFHGLGLLHPFQSKCNGGDHDQNIDTPVVNDRRGDHLGYTASATSFCVKTFWEELNGDWDLIIQRWNKLGIPEEDKNVWLDSCRDQPGYDDIGNWMTYSSEICQAVLGHWTPGQAQMAHFKTSELNPMMYAWGQYYAQNAASPPPAQISPPSPPSLPSSAAYSNFSICTITQAACQCKSLWSYNGKQYKACSQVDGITAAYPGALYCEVASPQTCRGCRRNNPCIQLCIGNYTDCVLPASPPPPFPPSPPPMPPPPPPRGMPDACKRAANGCECKRTWEDISYAQDQTYWNYCAPGAKPANGGRLRCQVTPSCPTFTPTAPFESCSPNLTAAFCGGGRPVIFSTSRQSPPPPSPRPK